MGTCFECGKPRHWRSFCPALAKQTASAPKWQKDQDISGVVLSCNCDSSGFSSEAVSDQDSIFISAPCNVISFVLDAFKDS